MNKNLLKETAQKMVVLGKGILAMDASPPTITKRFIRYGIKSNPDTRCEYRSMLITTPKLSEYITGAILFDETLRQSLYQHTVSFPEKMNELGIMIGARADISTKPLAMHPQERITEGLDNLAKRLKEYLEMGACFTKWRSVITIDSNLPTQSCIKSNAHALARYAAIAQTVGLVPIVEPEILINGNHTIESCYVATEKMLKSVFKELYEQKVYLPGIILKVNMITAGLDSKFISTPEQVAKLTIKCLKNCVPVAVSGIVFLSGGQPPTQATTQLNLINQEKHLPWPLTFSYGRALQEEALKLWGVDPVINKKKAQDALYHRVKLASLASLGQYNIEMEISN